MEYREYVETDIPSLIKLWRLYSEWGDISEDDFKKWYINTPYEKAEIIVAIDEKEGLIGQLMFTPCRIFCKKVYRAVRISAPVLHKDFRSNKYSLNHPILRLYITGMNLIKERGYDIVYVYPDRGWLTALRGLQLITGFRWKTKLFECCSINLHQSDSDFDHLFIKTTNFSEEYDHLFNQVISIRSDFCGIVRSGKWLNYKCGDFINFELRNEADSSLLGYISVRAKDGLLADLLCIDEKAAKNLIGMMLNEIRNGKDSDMKKLVIMRTAFINKVINEFNIIPVDYKFGFGYCILNSNAGINSDLFENWYNMPLD